ncbi:hypothetical protein J4436_03700 [Candidatus Woesearchaeota archaeon]|nr:hypothetical protein [Candidatus Woesearchaeota archaeon]
MKKNNIYIYLLIFFLVFVFIKSIYGANCWLYTETNNASCTAANACIWKQYSGGKYCTELACWNLGSQNECTNTVITGKNCTWVGSKTTNYCGTASCYDLYGTNQNTCENNSRNLGCKWSESCYNNNLLWSADCSAQTTRASCLNTTSCSWGKCDYRNCGIDYTTQSTCNAGKSWNGKNCTWSANLCQERWCSSYTNQTACASVTDEINCAWRNNWCQEPACYVYDWTNQTACVNNTYNLSCKWSSNYCTTQDCWTFTANNTCTNMTNCYWKSSQSTSYCEEAQCWSWDGAKGGNASACENNTYSMNCQWNDYSNATNATNPGWCYKDYTTTGCANKTTQYDCSATSYCWWVYTDLNNLGVGGSCQTPNWTLTNSSTTIFEEWNPGCYVFDMNQTNCNLTLGCNYSSEKCNTLTNNYGINITGNGIKCSYINDSNLCNSISVLSSCCSWQYNNCTANKLITTCWDQMSAPPAGANFCEDYSSYTDKSLCEQISGDPWYMPCKWDNTTERCLVDAADIFGNTSQSLNKLTNKRTCEFTGGNWITESYCEGNISVPTGRCESKFGGDVSCDKACYGCEYEDSDGNTVNATNADSACRNSLLGICEFEADTRASNNIGYCKTKYQYKNNVVVDCNVDCGACTYMGDPLSNDTTKRPGSYCENSNANSGAGGCKWVVDTSMTIGGYCLKKGDKTCLDACDRCYTQSDCQGLGRADVSNTSGACKWEGTSSDGYCSSNVGESGEICWDGSDNNNNQLIDCMDSACYSDSYCGFIGGECSGWVTQATCETNSCEWVVDKWGTWCDSPGSQCWKYDTNETYCNSRTQCLWQNGTGYSWCEEDWSQTQLCMGLSKANCDAASGNGCNWTADSWCLGTGNTTTWCTGAGGWCDHNNFKPKNCWMYTTSTNCNNTDGCNWYVDSYSTPHCEVNYSANCWQYYSNSTCVDADCWWRNDTWGGWCANPTEKCWSASTTAACANQFDANGNSLCFWRSDWTYTFCEPRCFLLGNQSSSSVCNAQGGCQWKDQNGWCQEEDLETCSSASNMYNQGGCQATSGCTWKESGWCDPKYGGFSSASTMGAGGVATAAGSNCYKYDGNQSLCTNKTHINLTCGWFPEPMPFCDVDWTNSSCWMYLSPAGGGCNATNNCWWNNESGYGWCTNIMDQCWMNSTLQKWANPTDWETECNNNLYCNVTAWGTCEPTCYNQTAQAGCGFGCKWMTGWCNPGFMNEIFTGMESGIMMPLGYDDCNETTIAGSIDICNIGVKDMVNAFGYGVKVRDFSNSSICNKEKLPAYIYGADKVGNGNDTIKLYVYLDTDGLATGGCALTNDTTKTGYEFRFKYTSTWDVNNSKSIESTTAYKCDDNAWAATDIKLTTWKTKMCSEISGPMVAVEKSELARFPTLYNSSEEIRIYVSTAGLYENISVVSDSIGPIWFTPGTIDFEIDSMFSYGANVAKFEDILKNGYVKYEDCFNGVDDDGDNTLDCYDWDCEFSSACTNLGVNSPGYTDARSPQVLGVKLEEYPDSALIMYDTNKPTNGTVEFYSNYSRCLTVNSTVRDIGLVSSDVRDYKLWHTANLYNGTNALNFSLSNQTGYYYKIKVCDTDSHCAVSQCSSIITVTNATCPYCNFVARIKTTSAWVISYDLDQNGVYEHIQGQVCGTNSGMKTNYTDGRLVNIKMAKNDSSVYFEFINASLTMTALNDKVRSIDGGADIISDSNILGLTSATRDKIIGNLHPEVCKLKIPFTGVCDTLYHCDDAGANCVDKTAEATLLDSINCVWKIPYCEFSSYRESLSTTSSSSGGGSSTPTGTTKTTVTNEKLEQGILQYFNDGDIVEFIFEGATHTVTVKEINDDNVKILVQSEPIEAVIYIGETKKFNLNADNFYDLSVGLDNIQNNTALLRIQTIKEQIISEIPTITEEKEAQEEVQEEQIEEETSLLWPIIIAILGILLIVGIYFVLKRKRFKL